MGLPLSADGHVNRLNSGHVNRANSGHVNRPNSGPVNRTDGHVPSAGSSVALRELDSLSEFAFEIESTDMPASITSAGDSESGGSGGGGGGHTVPTIAEQMANLRVVDHVRGTRDRCCLHLIGAGGRGWSYAGGVTTLVMVALEGLITLYIAWRQTEDYFLCATSCRFSFGCGVVWRLLSAIEKRSLCVCVCVCVCVSLCMSS